MKRRIKRKITAAVFALVIAVMSFAAAVPAFAASQLDDGVYEVGVKMYHAQKDKVSMGDRYLVHTALLKVESGNETLTIATAERVSEMHFWYYNNGGVDGDTTEVASVGEVTIDSKTYPTAFEFPVIGDSGDVGVKFSAPIMPVSPSARIRIDYSSAKKHVENTDNNAQPAAAPVVTTTAPAPATTVPQTTAAVTTTKAETTAAPAVASTTAALSTAVQSAAASTASEQQETGKSPVKIIVIICAAVLISAGIIVLIVLKVKGRI